MKKKVFKINGMVVVFCANPDAARKDHVFFKGEVVSTMERDGARKYRIKYKADGYATSGWFGINDIFVRVDNIP